MYCDVWSGTLTPEYGEHGDRTSVDPFDGKTQAVALVRGAHRIEQRQIVIRRRRGEKCIFTERLVIDEWFEDARGQQLARLRFKALRPIERFGGMTAPRKRFQVVNDVAACDDHNAFVAQRA